MNTKLKTETKSFIEINGFEELTAVQSEVLKYANSHKDIIALSKTGTGKTHAYLIPIMEMINPKSDKTQVVISLPTRELAYQVNQNCRLMQEVYPDLRIQLLAGGTDKKRSIEKFERTPHIVIGTPGRIKDLFESNVLRVDFVQMFVLDEADMTLEFGFLEDIDAVFSHMVKNPQVLCFSATFPEELAKFVNKYLNKPKTIRVTDKKRDPRIHHILVNCKHKDYKEQAFDILKGFKPYVCLIFANSKEYADETYEYLSQKGVKALLLHGGLDARTRQKAIKDLQAKKYSYVIASDVASRGIDIDGIVLKDVSLIENGVIKSRFGNQQYGYYLKAKPTGMLPVIMVEPGKTSFDDMKKAPYLRCVRFSAIQIDRFNGLVGGEVRLGFYFDGEKEIPVTGFTITGNMHEIKGNIVLSKEMTTYSGYYGPKYICLPDVKII